MSQNHPDPRLNQRNVLGTELASCCFDPLTGYFRNGFCHTGAQDIGRHTVCARMTSEFLNFSVQTGNDLVTPVKEFGFPGLKPGDFWCVCALRWIDALDQGKAPKIKLEACHESLLELIDIETLKDYAL